MRTRLATLIVLGLYAALWSPATAIAACDTPDYETALELADSVFVARIDATSNGGVTAEATVLAIWKGPDLSRNVTLRGGDTAADARVHEVGQTYLVVADWSPTAFVDDKCTATRLHTGLANEIPRNLQDAVGGAEVRLPLPADPATAGTSNTGALLFVGLGIVAFLGVVGAVTLSRATRAKPRRVAPTRGRPPTSREHTGHRKSPKQPRRTLAGWASGRFSRSGQAQVDHLKKR